MLPEKKSVGNEGNSMCIHLNALEIYFSHVGLDTINTVHFIIHWNSIKGASTDGIWTI